MKKTLMFVALASILSLATLVGLQATSYATNPNNNNNQVCKELDSGKIDVTGNKKTVKVTAPQGKFIDKYCVKAGSTQQGNGPEYKNVNPPQKTVTIAHSSGKDVSHYSVSYTDAYDYCDPSQKPSGSIYNWLTSQNPATQCVDYEVVVECGELSVLLTQNNTPYNYGFSYSEETIDWNYTTDASSVTFPEDYNGGSVEVFFWGVGPEGDYFTAVGLPWYAVSADSRVVNTDCEDENQGDGGHVLGETTEDKQVVAPAGAVDAGSGNSSSGLGVALGLLVSSVIAAAGLTYRKWARLFNQA